MVDGFDGSIFGPYEDEFESESIFSADDTFFIFFVVGGGSHMSEDEFGYPYIMFGVLGDVDTISIVVHCDGSGFLVDRNFDLGYFAYFFGVIVVICVHSYGVIATVYDSFIE